MHKNNPIVQISVHIMSAKEERALHLEMHKMTRKHTELAAIHAATEAECKRLRWLLAQESETRAANHSAAVQQFNTALDLEREKTNALHSRMEQERLVEMEQTRQESVAQRQSNADALVAIKRTMDAQFSAKMTELRSARLQCDEERERIKCDEARFNQEREQTHRQLNEAREQMKRDENEQLLQRVFRVDLEREQMQAERALIMEQAHKEAVALRQANEEAVGVIKRQLDAHCLRAMKLCEFDAAMQQQDRARIKRDEQAQIAKLNEDATALKTRLNDEHVAKMNERAAAFDAAMQKMNEEQAQIKRDKRAQIVKLNEDVRALKTRLNDEHVAKMNECATAFGVSMQKMNEERAQIAKLNEDVCALKTQLNDDHVAKMNECAVTVDAAMQKMNEERARIKRDERAQIAKLNEDATALKTQLNDEHVAKMNERAVAFDAAMQKMNEERAQIKRQNEEREQTRRQMNEDLAQIKRQMNEEQEQIRQQMTAEREQIRRQMTAEREQIKQDVLDHMSDSITSNHAHMQLIYSMDLRGKRVVVYSHYSEHNEVESYNVLAIERIEHYFDHVIILTNCPNKWVLHSPNYNKCHLLGYNMKSDFRNYGVFLMQAASTLINASRLCFINDSFIIVDVSAFGKCVKQLFENERLSHDFVGLTSSHEGVFHVQSYFMCFDAPAIPAVLSYFETHGLPMNHQSAISKYELGITAHLIDTGFSSFAVVSNGDMRFPVNTTCCKWAAVLEHAGIIKRQHFLKQYPRHLAMTDANIALVAENHAYNKHFIDFLKYNRSDVFPA